MLNRTRPPKSFSPEFNSFPGPSVSKLQNGLPLYCYNLGHQPVFRLELIFRFGSADVTSPSAASIACNMLREGTINKSADELNNLLDYYGSFLDIKAGLDYTTLSLYGRSEFLSELLPIIGEILREPSFQQTALEKHRKLTIQNLEINQKKTSYWSTRLLRQNIFGEKHSYSKIPKKEEIENIELSLVQDFHRQLVQSLDAILLSGSYDQSAAEKSINDEFAKISLDPSSSEVIRPVYGGGIITKKLSQTTQASIALGGRAISPFDKDYPIHSFIVKLLGGYFGSRLMKTLREDKGLTYGVHAYMLQLRQGEFIQIAADVKLDAVDESIDVIKHEITRFLNEPVGQDELDTVKNYMLGEYVNDSNTAFDFAGLYKKIILQNLPVDYFDNFYGRIANLNLDEIEEAKHLALDVDKLVTVKVN